MIIDLSRTTKETIDFEKTFAPDELDLDEQTSMSEPLSARGNIRRRGEEAFLRGTIKGGVSVNCSRCLKEAVVPVETEISAHLVTLEQYTAQKAERLNDEEDFQTEVYDGVNVNLAEIVREQILVDLPVKNVCREDCRGLCPQCGTNLNEQECSCPQNDIDPRWAALKNLKN